MKILLSIALVVSSLPACSVEQTVPGTCWCVIDSDIMICDANAKPMNSIQCIKERRK